MRILWFTNTPANSDEYFNSELRGTGGWLKALDQALQDKVELHVAFYHPQPSSSFSYQKTTYHPIKRGCHYIKLLKSRLLQYVPDTEDQDIYLNLINTIKPDIIHIHGTENPFGCIVGKTSTPIIISIQGNITVCHHKYFSGIERKYSSIRKESLWNIKQKLLSETFRTKYKKFRKMKTVELRNLQNCQYIIGRTNWDKRVSRVLAPQRIYYHNDEILRDPFYNFTWTYRNSNETVLHTTTGDSFYKGFETLCLALSELNRQGISVKWRVAGISKNDLIVKIVKKKLKSNYPREGLQLLGKVTADDLSQYLLEADIYVMPSHIENSPNNLCEAMLIGMPCIAAFSGGTGSMLEDGKEGILIQDGDPWVMAGAILELTDNPEKAQLFGSNARKRATKRHDKDKITTDLLKIYKTVATLNS